MSLPDTVDSSEHTIPEGPKQSIAVRTILIIVGVIFAVTLLVVTLAALLAFGASSTETVDDRALSTATTTSAPIAAVVESTTTTGSVAPASTATSRPPLVDEVLDFRCSAGEMDPPRGQPELPDAVLATRSRIITAARTCDFQALAELVPETFLASFGGGDAIELWKEQEARGDRPLAAMVTVLSLPHAVVTTDDGPEDSFGPRTFHVWPTAATYGAWDDIPVEDRWALRELYTETDLADFADVGGYVGYRISIAETGEWQFFVNGD